VKVKADTKNLKTVKVKADTKKTTEKQNPKTIINSKTKSNTKEELRAIPR